MERFQRTRIEQVSTSLMQDEKSGQETAPDDFLGTFKSNVTRVRAYEQMGTHWRKLLGDSTFLDVVAAQGIDGE